MRDRESCSFRPERGNHNGQPAEHVRKKKKKDVNDNTSKCSGQQILRIEGNVFFCFVL